MRHRRALAITASAMLVLLGCASAPSALPEGVSVSLLQLRSDVADRQAQVQVFNGSDEVLEIAELSVEDPRFARSAVRVIDRISELAPGGTTNVRVQLPAFTCPASGTASTLTIGYTHRAQQAVASVPLAEGIPFLAAMHERECFGARLAEIVEVSLAGFEPSAAGEPAGLLLSLVPSGDGSAVIRGIHQTNLLTFAGGVAVFPIEAHVDTGAAPQTLALPLLPWRCDPHAVQEDKRGTVFRIEAEVEGAAGQIELAASPELRGTLLGWVASWCRFGQ